MCVVEYWVCKRFHDKLGFGGGVGGALLWSEVGVEYSMQEKSASEVCIRIWGKRFKKNVKVGRLQRKKKGTMWEKTKNLDVRHMAMYD